MNYGDLIGNAFRIAWRNRYLWFFGFFIGGGVGYFNFSVPPNSGSASSTGGVPAWLVGIGEWAQENIALAVALGAVVFVLFLVFFVGLTLVSTGGLADSVGALSRGERRSFASTWRAGVRNLWRVFFYSLLFALISLIPLIVIGGPAALGIFGIVSATESVGLRILLISLVGLAAFALLLVVTVTLYLVGQLALRELVIERRGVFSAIGGGYRLFRRNLGRTVVAWLIQVAISLAVTAVLFIVIFVVNIAQTAGFFALSSAASYPLVVGVAVVVGLIVSLPLILLAAIIGVFNHAYWTLAYLQLKAGRPPQREYSTGTTG
ncbi:MAG: DUF7544 domain-containing protein [Rubrobacteraceae bacterium]